MDLTSITDFVTASANQPWIYLVVLLCCLIDGFFPPVPSESLVVALSVVAAGNGWEGLGLLFGAAVTGAFLGDNIAYQLGRRLGTERFSWLRRPGMRRAMTRTAAELERRGTMFLLTARFIHMARVALNMTAGAGGFPTQRFVGISCVSAVLWGAYSVGLGAMASAWTHENPLLGMILGVTLAMATGLFAEWLTGKVRRRRQRTSATAANHATDSVDA